MNFKYVPTPLRWSLAVFYFILVFSVTNSICSQKFDDYKVYRVTASTVAQLNTIKSLEGNAGVSFWKFPRVLNANIDVMLSPEKEPDVLAIFKAAGLSYNAFIDNVQALIDNENPSLTRSSRDDDNDTMNWTAYHRLDVIYNWLDELAETYSNLVEIIVAGESYEGRLIKGIKITFNEENKGIFVEGGLHAREWISPATVTYLINEILTTTDTQFKYLVQSHNWFIFPNTNPDGYEYSHTDYRLWRKTRKPNDDNCTCDDCTGADPNRNFDYYWLANSGASTSPCDETYAGSEPFSEPEVRALADYITAVKDDFYIYLSIHSYSQLLLLPYGYIEGYLDNYDDVKYIGDKAAEALAVRYGTNYTVGSTANVLYVASGVSTDWVKGVFKTPIVYCYELRDTGTYGFLLPADQIIPTSLEFLDSLVALLGEARKLGYPDAPVDLV